MSKRLFDLSDEILSLESALDDESLTDEARQLLVYSWLEVQGDVTTKLDNYAAFIEDLEALAASRKAQAQRMKQLAQADENRALRLKEALKIYFKRHDLTKFKTPRFTLSLQTSGGKRALIVPPSWEQDPANAPEQFRKVVVQLDTDEIRRAVEGSYADAETITAAAKTDEERRALFNAWLDSDPAQRWKKQLIEGCSLAERGQSIRIR